ncbi:cyclic nucleotide gated channel 19 [Euphorbia peplus]|nr:cyclic nucleotide gated channel 19 [Euphorbia peplus]
MAGCDKDEVPMLSDVHPQLFDENVDSRFPAAFSRTRSASISISMESFENEANLVGYTGPLRSARRAPIIQMSGPIYTNRKTDTVLQTNHGGRGQKIAKPKVEKASTFNEIDQPNWTNDQYPGKNENLLRSGQLGVCNDPYCTTCPTYYKFKPTQHKHSRTSNIFDSKFHNSLYGDAKGWARRLASFVNPYIPGVMNPHTTVVQLWNKFFVISCLVAIFVDPLFFFLLSVQKDNKCIVIDWPLTTTIVVFRSMTDFIYLLNILLQFRLAYIAPESRVIGTGELVDDPKKIARQYLCGYFAVDLFIVLPLPQIIILMILPDDLGNSGANNAKNFLRAAVLVQYIPRLYRFLPLLVGVSPTGFIFETAWANFFINLLTFMLSGHVVGSCWYLFGLQRVNQCLRDACRNSPLKDVCMEFIDCGHRTNLVSVDSNPNRTTWKQNENATACFTEGFFPYGIYVQAVNLTTERSIATRYIYSLFWGFQQISTLAGNQVPSYFVWEVLFTMAIVGLGLLLFAFLIGNIQNFLQALGRRRLEMSLRRRDFDEWMSHRRLPQELRRKVLEAERYNWAATRGINEEMLLENLPEDLQRDIRRHFFKFVKNVWIFALMDDNVFDAICERLKQKIYIKGSKILFQDGLVEKMVFIVRGKLESIGENGNVIQLCEGNVCGEELLTWCLGHSSVNNNKDAKKIKGQRLISSRTVRCLTNVEAFSLHAADLEEVTNIFARNFRNPRVRGAIRYESPYWRGLAAQRIQVAWRYRQKRLKRADTAQLNVSN